MSDVFTKNKMNLLLLGPDRNSGPVTMEFGPVPVDLAGTAIFYAG